MDKETLEEAAEKYVKSDLKKTPLYGMFNDTFIEGAKWQQERSYSIEQISKDFVGEGTSGGYFDDFLDYRIESGTKITFKEWFEQFKKK